MKSEGGATLSGYDFEPKRDLYEPQMDVTKSTTVEQETKDCTNQSAKGNYAKLTCTPN